MAKRKPTVPAVTDEDAALFREAIGEVRPIEAPEAGPARPRPAPTPRMRALDEAEALAQSRSAGWFEATIDAAEALAYRRDEVPEKVLKALKRGQYVIGGELDLHQMRAPEAERWLREFLAESRRFGHACVRVIHGKGLGRRRRLGAQGPGGPGSAPARGRARLRLRAGSDGGHGRRAGAAVAPAPWRAGPRRGLSHSSRRFGGFTQTTRTPAGLAAFSTAAM